jgi:epoxyqueuosine reductase
VISPTQGPYLLLSELVTSLDLPADPPALGSCGTCTACLDACPTQAIVAPHQVDARRCISYTTIELRGFIPTDLRQAHGDRVFGCDVCLEVCPFTSKGRAAAPSLATRPEMRAHPALETFDLVGVLELTEQQYAEQWTGTAMRRATRTGLRRNAAVVLGNLQELAAVPALTRAVTDPDPVVRGHAAWALGRLGEGRAALETQLAREAAPRVQEEIRAALEGWE